MMDSSSTTLRVALFLAIAGAVTSLAGAADKGRVRTAGSKSPGSDSGSGSHPCERPCVEGKTMTCRYDFHVENYHSLSKACYGCPWNATDCERPDCIAADGVPRALVVVNRQLPGPGLQVCLGDRIEVTVHNHMPEQSTSVHWHGLQQRGTPYMDGVPFVTQCPIAPHSAFRYTFRADNAGTHFWHSHTGCQRADGTVGHLTVRVPRERDPHAALYDEDLPEHGLLVLDWTHQLAASKFLAHHHAGDDNKADSVLINGKGVYRRFDADGKVLSRPVYTPRQVYNVHQRRRYRFRLVNAGFLNCPLELSVDNHTMLVIASDGADLQPVRVDSLVSYAGERWDVIVEADQAVASYWLRLHGLLDCGPRRAHEAAILRYEGADPAVDPAGPLPAYDVPRRGGLQVNSLNRGSLDPDTLTAAELRGVPQDEPDPALKPKADVQLYVSYDFYAQDNPLIHRAGLYGISQVANSPYRVFTPQLNYISLNLPPFPLLPGRDRLQPTGPGSLCNVSSLQAEGRDCEKEFCECTHTVQVPLGSVLEIILVDKGVRYDANHPFHLHGHAFRVVGLERIGTSTSVQEVQRLDAEGLLSRNLDNPPIKDTVTVPDGGYTVLRVLADNPGYWLFHCHIEFHVELGMAMVIKVGEHEDMPPIPSGFPQCGDWSSDWLGEDDDDQVPDHGDDVNIVPSNHISGSGRALPLPSPVLPDVQSQESTSSGTVPAPETSPTPATSGPRNLTEVAAETETATVTVTVTYDDDADADVDSTTTEGIVAETTPAETLHMLDIADKENVHHKYMYDVMGADSNTGSAISTGNTVSVSTTERATPAPAVSVSTAAKSLPTPWVTLSEYIMRVEPRPRPRPGADTYTDADAETDSNSVGSGAGLGPGRSSRASSDAEVQSPRRPDLGPQYETVAEPQTARTDRRVTAAATSASSWNVLVALGCVLNVVLLALPPKDL